MKGTVIIISPVHWHFTWQNAQHIASGLAQRNYRVLFIEPLPKRWPQLSELDRVWGRIRGESIAAGTVEQPLVEGVELIAPRLLPDVGRIPQAINRQLFIPAISASLLRTIEDGPLYLINYLPTPASVSLTKALKADATFYRCVNDWPNDPYSPGSLQERELVQAADMVWADSKLNYERTSAMRGNVVTMTEGVDLSLFNSARFRNDFERNDGPPRCAFFGSVSVNTDVNLLRAVSHEFPLRLIGPIRVELADFSPSTEIIGAVPHDELPALLEDADVLLLPYDRQSPHSTAILPAKLFECLATGKPSIVSGLTTLGELQSLFYLTTTPEEFLQAIRDSANEPLYLRDARIACAEQNSYDQRLDEIEGYFAEVFNAKGSTSADATRLRAEGQSTAASQAISRNSDLDLN